MLTTVIEVSERNTAHAYRRHLTIVRPTNQAKTATVGDKIKLGRIPGTQAGGNSYLGWKDATPLTDSCSHAYIVRLSINAAPVAQLDRASVYGTEGWGFEPLQAYVRLCLNTRSGFERPFFRLAVSGSINDATNIACFAVSARRKQRLPLSETRLRQQPKTARASFKTPSLNRWWRRSLLKRSCTGRA